MSASILSSAFRQRTILVAVLLLLGSLGVTTARADDADDRFALAAGNYQQQRWELAVEEFRDYLLKYPHHHKANQGIFFVAEALLQLGFTEEAEVRFRQYLNREPEGRYARPATFRAGEAAYLAGKADLAKVDLQRYQADYPDDKLNAYVLPYLGDLALSEADATAAARYFRSGIARFPDGPLYDDCCFGLARAMERLDFVKEAEQLYQTVAEKPDSLLADDAQFHLGALQYAMGKHAKAVDTFIAFETTLGESPWLPHARMGRGWALMKLGRVQEAKPLFESIASHPLLGVEAMYWLGMAQRAEEDWAAAAKTLLAAAAVDPKHELVAEIRFHAGDTLRRAGDTAAAFEQFDLVIASTADNNEWIDDAMHGKILTALAAKDYTTADREVVAFDKRFPDGPLKGEVCRTRVQSLLTRKRYTEALKLLLPLVDGEIAAEEDIEHDTEEDVEEDAKDDLANRYLLAQAYEGLKRHDDALETLQPVLEAADERLATNARLMQGSLLLSLQRYSEAIQSLEEFLATGPSGDTEAKGRGELAICYARAGQLDKAKTVYADLVEKYSGHKLIAPTTEQLAEAAYDAKDTKWSARLFHWLQTEGSSSEYKLRGLHGVGWNLFNAGQLTEAATAFEKLLAKDPPAEMAAEAAWVRGRIMQKLGPPDAALAMYNLVIDKYPESEQHPKALLAAARLRDKLQQDQQSLALYERLTIEYPELPDLDAVLYEWAWVLDELDRKDKSAALFELIRKKHPKSRYWPDATYRLARRALAANDYARANALTTDVLLRTPDAGIRQHTLYLRGQIAVSEAQWSSVGDAFAALLEEFPNTPRRLTAKFWIAEAAYRKGDYEAAGRHFDLLSRETHGRPETWLAMVPLRRAQVAAQQKKWNETFAIAKPIEEEYPNFQQQYEADYLIGLSLADGADFRGAREAFRKVIRSPIGSKTETAAMAQWRIGETYFHQKNYEAAVRAYLPVSILYAYPAWQALALLQAGKCHEHLDQADKAAKLYAQILRQYPDTPSAESARRRIKGVPVDRAEPVDQQPSDPSEDKAKPAADVPEEHT